MPKYTEKDIIPGTEKITANGMLAGRVMGEDGKEKFRFIKVVDEEKRAAALQRSRNSPQKKIGKQAAINAFNRHYDKKEYKNEKARKAAKTRDACWDNHPSTDTTKYRRSPHLHDYPGVDDGTNEKLCPGGPHNWKSGKAPAKKMEKGSAEAKAWHEKMMAAQRAKRQEKMGGAEKQPVSLKTAVRLLRQYYQNKYA